jgi:hypothetical protein
MMVFSIDLDLRLPLVETFGETYAFEARSVVCWNSAISYILSLSGGAQIIPAVIEWPLWVFVIYRVHGPFARHVEPRQPSASVKPAVDPYDPMAGVTPTAGQLTPLPIATLDGDQTNKLSCVRVVLEQFFQAFQGYHRGVSLVVGRKNRALPKPSCKDRQAE